MFAIYKKELRSYFINAVGYVYAGVFLAASALIFGATTIMANTYETTQYFTMLIFAFIILIPLLTMKLFAEEKKLKTEQLLLTAPVTITGMVFGKFLAAFTMFLGGMAVSLINFAPLIQFARAQRAGEDYLISHVGPSLSRIMGSLIGIILIGTVFIAIGLFISSLTENQLAAAIITVAVIAGMIVLNLVNQYINVYAIRFVIDWVSVISRYSNFNYGLLDFSAMLYYISLTFVFLMLTVRVYDKRRWG